MKKQENKKLKVRKQIAFNKKIKKKQTPSQFNLEMQMHTNNYNLIFVNINLYNVSDKILLVYQNRKEHSFPSSLSQ